MKKFKLLPLILVTLFISCNATVTITLETEETAAGETTKTENKETASVTGITITSEPSKVWYLIGTEISYSGFSLRVDYSDNSNTVINKGYSFSVPEGTTITAKGKQTVTVTYNDFTADFSIYGYDINLDDVYNSGLPALTIDTEDDEEPTCESIEAPNGCWGIGSTNATKVKGSLTIKDESGSLEYSSGSYEKNTSGMTIKIRGNTSATASKKPYKIKLEKKANLLNDGNNANKNKEWILLSIGTDMRTPIGFEIASLTGDFNYIPEFRFVNLILNNEYKGLYILCESISKSEGRINVSDTGYIIEQDAYWWNEDVYFYGSNDSVYPMRYTFKYPDSDDVTQEQIDYIQTYMDNVEKSVLSTNYADYIDIDSFASWLLTHDILGTWDSGGSNIYFTKEDNTEDSKLFMTTPWDFDSNYMQVNQWARIHDGYYFANLLTKDDFKNLYKEKWKNLKDSLYDDFTSDIETKYSSSITAMETSRQLDAERWCTSHGTYEENIKQAQDWLTSRITWLNENINAIE